MCIHRDPTSQIHWVSSSLFGVSQAIQEFGLARFKSNVTKSTKGFKYMLALFYFFSPKKTTDDLEKKTKRKDKYDHKHRTASL